MAQDIKTNTTQNNILLKDMMQKATCLTKYKGHIIAFHIMKDPTTRFSFLIVKKR